jgi:hypothetical protein
VTDVLPTASGEEEQDVEDLQARLAQAKQEMAGPIPLIPDAPDCLITLVRGVAYAGARQTEAEVRELTGVDEEAIGKYKRAEDVFDAVVYHGVERIGALHKSGVTLDEWKMYLRSLLIGERDVLFIAVAQVTYGDERSYNITCKDCSREQELNVKLSEEFKPKKVDLDSPLTYTTSKGLKLEYRLATGADQLEVLSKDGRTTADEHADASQCIISVNGGMAVIR